MRSVMNITNSFIQCHANAHTMYAQYVYIMCVSVCVLFCVAEMVFCWIPAMCMRSLRVHTFYRLSLALCPRTVFLHFLTVLSSAPRPVSKSTFDANSKFIKICFVLLFFDRFVAFHCCEFPNCTNSTNHMCGNGHPRLLLLLFLLLFHFTMILIKAIQNPFCLWAEGGLFFLLSKPSDSLLFSLSLFRPSLLSTVYSYPHIYTYNYYIILDELNRERRRDVLLGKIELRSFSFSCLFLPYSLRAPFSLFLFIPLLPFHH